MDEKKELEALRHDNQRLCEALREITKKIDEINGILKGVGDLTTVREPQRGAPVTEEEVKNLLKKYSKLS